MRWEKIHQRTQRPRLMARHKQRERGRLEKGLTQSKREDEFEFDWGTRRSGEGRARSQRAECCRESLSPYCSLKSVGTIKASEIIDTPLFPEFRRSSNQRKTEPKASRGKQFDSYNQI